MKQVILRNGRVAFSCISPGTEGATLSSTEVRMGLGLLKSALRYPNKVRQVIASFKTRGFQATKALIQDRIAFGSAVGYSCAGVIAEVGEGVETFRPGDRVACAGSGYANYYRMDAGPRADAPQWPSRGEGDGRSHRDGGRSERPPDLWAEGRPSRRILPRLWGLVPFHFDFGHPRSPHRSAAGRKRVRGQGTFRAACHFIALPGFGRC